MLITTLTYGGAETQVVRLAKELKARNWEVAVACMVAPSAHTEELKSANIPVYSLDMKRGVPDPRAIFQLAALIKRFSPDVVHAHMVHANLLGRLTRLVCPIRVLICTAHNLRETSEKGGPTWHKEMLYRVTDFLSERTTIICQAAYDRYLQKKASPASKLLMIPNGVDTDKFAPSEEIRIRTRKDLNAGDSFLWLAVGRLVEQKDYPNLFNAITKLPEGNWRVVIAGNGPLEHELKELTAKLAITDRVQFIGARNNMADLFKASDAFVMSSAFEGLSMALLEASSTGLASVVTDVGGNRELVIDNETGYVVPAQNTQKLADGMTNLMNLSEIERQELGRAARKRCLRDYRFQAVAEKWIQLYNGLLHARSKAAIIPMPIKDLGTTGERNAA